MANPWENMEDDDGGGDADKGFGEFATAKNATIFLIDCSARMRAGPCFGTAIRGVLGQMSTKIITAPRDPIGVVFYGSKHKKNANEFSNIHEFLELGAPSARSIQSLERLAPGEDDDDMAAAAAASRFDSQVRGGGEA